MKLKYECMNCKSEFISKTNSRKDGMTCPICRGLLSPTGASDKLDRNINMKYIKRQSVIEAVKWDGKLETIENNKWLEDALKDEKIIIATNKLTDKEAVLLIEEGNEYTKVKDGMYVAKKEMKDDYYIYAYRADEFEMNHESIDEFIQRIK